MDFKWPLTPSQERNYGKLVEIGVPSKWKAAIQMLYEQVKDKIKTKEDFPESFNTNIGMKQGCPLFPTLFRVYTNNLEKWINMKGEGKCK